MTQRQDRQIKRLLTAIDHTSKSDMRALEQLQQKKNQLRTELETTALKKADVMPTSPFDMQYAARIREALTLRQQSILHHITETDLSIKPLYKKVSASLRAKIVLKALSKSR
ncbi:MAG: hypothetical protein AAGD92_07050 [Pseudomonadota bacterium]